MPNHITNELRASKRVIDSLASDKGAVDFNTVVPMPEILRDESSEPLLVDWAKVALGQINLETLGVRHRHPAASFRDGDFGSAADALHQSNVLRMLTQGPFPKDFDDARFERFIRYIRALKQYGFA